MVLGALLGLGLVLTGNSDFREQGGWGAFAYLIMVGAIIGGVSALAAVAGGFVAILITLRSGRATESSPLISPIGPAVGSSVPWVVAAGVAAVVGDPMTAGIAVGLGVVAAVVGGVSAALLLRGVKYSSITTAADDSGALTSVVQTNSKT
ncbi:hypothetical protein C5C36_15595 [Rathayibacter sp. AY1G1]|nr:hypothetical protein C5B98_14070 [Rathayibacter sp. AY1A5]PPF25832.1 hypothetical protein C5C54_14375 [Rathayibacter sp. AY1F2]PPF33128.1 hypothetical protein C5B93_14585 [Rathayibacter sp. AY1A2]PPF69111.1 hypothetical protein C5C46_13610 [Rathayibacter sp. AY1E6]PPG08990.1 hypothetical protein C5C26_06950 [Rathayibacter sp. AY2B1]PPG13259.1 hypothetical protein C5D36_13705 [Rathayibacter sp. AY1C6]PPG50771.1 hypothetical protein C5C24_09135 [Rathayibacter sp. AY2B3]PPG67643.1 hypothetic